MHDEPGAKALLAERLDALCRMLGYKEHPTFITSLTGRSSHVVRQALTTIGISGIFALEDGFEPSALKPIVYLAAAPDLDFLRGLRKDVWSQGAVPFLLVVTPTTIEICSGFEPPTATTISVAYDDAGSLPDYLANFAADHISSCVTWNDFVIHRDSSVDNNLVNAIEALNKRARSEFPEFRTEKDLVNALIGKFIYIYVLIDRHILSVEWLSSQLPPEDQPAGTSFLHAILEKTSARQPEEWTARAAMTVFDVVDTAINGCVFNLTEEQQGRIPDGLCHLVHRVVRCGEVLFDDGVSQPGFFNVSFGVLRTETISAIYERFVSIADSDRRRDEGVFYTPPHLADHVLDRMEAVKPITKSSRLIDPAAGSGIFLVGAYRRLMERNAPDDGWLPGNIDLAKTLLLNSIYGIEKHPQAANVCRFSLYLTLLDYVGRAPIEELITAAGESKFLPDLTANIRSADAFEIHEPLYRYTHVIGNPPWPTTTGQKDRTNRNSDKKIESPAARAFALELRKDKLSFVHNRLSDLFTWLALRRLSAEGAVIALVLPAKSVIGRSASSFAHDFARHATIRWVGNLSHLRRKLFDGVEAPACVVVAVNRSPTNADRTAVYRPLLSSLPGGRRAEIWSLLASQAEVQILRATSLQSGPNGWFVQTMLGEFDRRMHEALGTWAQMHERTLKAFFDRSHLIISKGGSPRETGVRRDRGQKTLQLLPLTQSDLADVAGDFRGFFSGNVILIPRSMNKSTYHSDPVAYPSTFNGLIPATQWEEARQAPIPISRIPYLSPDFVAGFLSYINSTVVQYFASLFGASYLMDKARLERTDLLTLPCPFENSADPKLLALAASKSADESILDAMNAGTDFRAAFKEFAEFRRYFANAQVPSDSMRPASESIQRAYIDRLRAEIIASFGSDRQVDASISFRDGRQTRVVVSFGSRREFASTPARIATQFLGSSIVTFDRENETSLIIKSPTRHAWTIDQAVADAVAVGREVRSSH